ncbi:hypothetical protein RRG08_009415 [Elysia crispata]|uniref:Uncharacterized protein n=1 Tax=Elysia crispata TaxID=231223 RepID=A0AAE0Y8J5_9GAST|nr:hypothetical protein RRG08_009415 [Elysia crispata]
MLLETEIEKKLGGAGGVKQGPEQREFMMSPQPCLPARATRQLRWLPLSRNYGVMTEPLWLVSMATCYGVMTEPLWLVSMATCYGVMTEPLWLVSMATCYGVMTEPLWLVSMATC